jgi:hypothetical protein
VRVVSWNLAFRGPTAAKRQGGLLRELDPDLMLLQELNPGSSEVLKNAAGADWMVRAIDRRTSEPDDSRRRRPGVAIAGHGLPQGRSWLLDKIQLSERILFIETQTEGTPFIAVSYHAPPGVTWGIVKPQQAVTFARWLSTQNGPLLFGADANTPLIDALDFANTRTHWYTGNRKLHGEPGDDRLFGPCKVHDLDDALRRWLALHPNETDGFHASKPSAEAAIPHWKSLSPARQRRRECEVPLAITHRTGKRKNSPGTGRRFDSVWVSRHWVVRHVEHLYEKGIAAGSDHAPVMVDLDLTARPGKEEETWGIELRQHQSRIGSSFALAAPFRSRSLYARPSRLGMPASVGIADVAMGIDWPVLPNRLVAGDLSGIDPEFAEIIKRYAELPEAIAMAGGLGIDAVALVIALVARVCGSRIRWAAPETEVGQRVCLPRWRHTSLTTTIRKNSIRKRIST